METKIRNLLTDVERELKVLLGDKLSTIFLYGSYARGDHSKYSDVDIFVLTPEEDTKQYDKPVIRIAVDLSLKYEMDLSIIVETWGDYTENKDIIPLYRNVASEGVLIYAA